MRANHRFVRLIAGWIAVASMSAVAPTESTACGNEYTQYYVVGEARRVLDRAEADLARGDSGAAFRAAREVQSAVENGTGMRSFATDFRTEANGSWHINHNDAEGAPSNPQAVDTAAGPALLQRAQLLWGISMARLDGQFNQRMVRLRRASATQRAARYAEAIGLLQRVLTADANNVRAQVYLAEARVRLDANNTEARRALRGFAARDVIPDAVTWAYLAQIETQDPAAQTRAHARCTAMAGAQATRVCGPAPTAPVSP
ncbi:MAG: hypothetical protein Q8Q09_19860 [Deltaproteobacteria bacterium]|nr:hypothetical protein [Deltaproteobacteria bacterium]